MAADDTQRAASLGITEAQGRLAQSRPVDAFIAAAHGATALARGKVVAAQGSLDLARLQLAHTHVEAPAAGRVSSLTARVAQTLSAGQAFAEFVPDLAYVTADFKEAQTEDMHAGQRAKISIDAYPHREFEGRVESLSAGTGAVFSLLPPDNATGNFVKVVQRVPVRIVFTPLPRDIELRPGLSADVTVYLH
jgi:membrane fusion protein (multidrug efflux system)